MEKKLSISESLTFVIYMSQTIEEIRHFRKCLGNCRNSRHFRKCLGNWGNVNLTIFKFNIRSRKHFNIFLNKNKHCLRHTYSWHLLVKKSKYLVQGIKIVGPGNQNSWSRESKYLVQGIKSSLFLAQTSSQYYSIRI